MATDLDKIRQAFQILAAVDFPDGYIGEMEVAAINAHLETTKAERARYLLATRGRREAAAILGCSEAQVYRLARFPQSSAGLETAA